MYYEGMRVFISLFSFVAHAKVRNNGDPNNVNEYGLVVSLVRTFMISLKFRKSYFIPVYHHFVDMETWEEFKNSSWFHSTYDAYP
jgi:hypothetical protein